MKALNKNEQVALYTYHKILATALVKRAKQNWIEARLGGPIRAAMQPKTNIELVEKAWNKLTEHERHEIIETEASRFAYETVYEAGL